MIVTWEESTVDRLTDLYDAAAAADRDRIAAGVERINAHLAQDPWSVGESRGPGRRVWFSPPLVVAYDLPPGEYVRVNHVALFDPRPQDD